jgi:hypothetical protein
MGTEMHQEYFVIAWVAETLGMRECYFGNDRKIQQDEDFGRGTPHRYRSLGLRGQRADGNSFSRGLATTTDAMINTAPTHRSTDRGLAKSLPCWSRE